MFIVFNIFNAAHDLFHGNVLIMLAREPSSGTVPAIHGALVRNKKQYPIRITVGHPRHRAEFIFRQGIRIFIRGKMQFIGSGNRLFPDRVVGIVKVDQRKIIGSHRHPESPQCRFNSVTLFLSQNDAVLFQILYSSGSVGDLPAPVIPIFLCYIFKQPILRLHLFPS